MSNPNEAALARNRSLGSWPAIAAGGVGVVVLLAIIGAVLLLREGSAQADSGPPFGVSTTTEDDLAMKPFTAVQAFSMDARPPRVEVLPEPVTLPSATTPSQWGAVAALHQAVSTALNGADPQVAERTLDEFVLATPDSRYGAFDAWLTELNELRRRADFPTTGPVSGFSAHTELAGAQVRGTSRAGTFVVACVVEELWISYPAVGDRSTPFSGCARMWWNGSRWVAEGKATAEPPAVWPNTQPMLDAGFQPAQLGVGQ